MTPEEFINGIKVRAIESPVASVLSNLAVPPGRRPKPHDVAASLWFNDLNDEDKIQVKYIIREAAEYAAFSFCCVIDGVAVIEPVGPKSEFRLVCISPDGAETVLNPPDGDMLHDILNAK